MIYLSASNLLFLNDNTYTLGDATHRPLSIEVGTNGVASAGPVGVKGANGQATRIVEVSQLISSTASTTFNSTIDIPASAVILGVCAFVTATMSNTATALTLKGATSAKTFCTSIGVVPGSSSKGMEAGVYVSAAAEKIQVVMNSAGGTTGALRVTVHYLDLTIATS